MNVVDTGSGELHDINISPVDESDYKSITKARYWFDWKEEKKFEVYKLRIKGKEDILGLISLETFSRESRIEIRLLAVSKDNRGKKKKYEHIAGNLIAFTCIQAIKHFGEWACVSLVPKTELIEHYTEKYFMINAGRSLFLDGMELIQLIKKYDHD